MRVHQFELNLDEPGIVVSLDPDPTGAAVRAAKARGLLSEAQEIAEDVRLSGSLRITLPEAHAEKLAADLFKSLKE